MPASLDWLAGVFEGEGTIRINAPTRRNNGHLVISVVNTDRQMVEAFAERWPRTQRQLKPMKMDGNRRPAWVWLTAARLAETVLLELGPHFRTERVREKLRVALEFQRQKTSTHDNRSLEYRARQIWYFETMKALNLRGINGQKS